MTSFANNRNTETYRLPSKSQIDFRRREFKDEHMGRQFVYLLYRYGFMDYVISDIDREKLLQGSFQTPYNVHHRQPLSVGGSNGFFNLCLIERNLHSFLHDIYFERAKQMECFHLKSLAPNFAPITTTKDFFWQTIDKAVKFCNQTDQQISLKDVTNYIDEKTLTGLNFDIATFKQTKDGIISPDSIDQMRPKDIPDRTDILNRFLFLWRHGLSDQDFKAMDLIQKGALPKYVLSEESIFETTKLTENKRQGGNESKDDSQKPIKRCSHDTKGRGIRPNSNNGHNGGRGCRGSG